MQLLVKQADGRYGFEASPQSNGIDGLAAKASPVSKIAQRLQQLGNVGGPGWDEDWERKWTVRPAASSERGSSYLSFHSSGAGALGHGILDAAKQRGRSTLGAEQRRPAEISPRSVATEPEEQLRKKLLALSSSFAGLDKQVEEDVRKRKELEEKRCHELLLVLGKLEHDRQEEAKNRELEMIAVRQAVENRCNDMVDHIQGRLSERFGKLIRSVERLCERCSTVERGLMQFKGELPSKLQVETASLKSAIQELASEFSLDKQRAADRDAEFLQRIEENEFSVDIKMQKELTLLERRGEALQQVIDQFAAAEDEPETQKKRSPVWQSFTQLRELLAQEVTRREEADDKVVQAINEYTSTLHRSLSATNA